MEYIHLFQLYLFNQLLQNSQYHLTNLIFKKFQRALENVLAGTFLPPGSGLATPGIGKAISSTAVFNLPVAKIWVCKSMDFGQTLAKVKVSPKGGIFLF